MIQAKYQQGDEVTFGGKPTVVTGMHRFHGEVMLSLAGFGGLFSHDLVRSDHAPRDEVPGSSGYDSGPSVEGDETP